MAERTHGSWDRKLGSAAYLPDMKRSELDQPPVAIPTLILTVHEAGTLIPGQDVAVAIITGHTDAAHTGVARALIDPASPIPDHLDGLVEVLLLGRVSGTTVIRRLS